MKQWNEPDPQHMKTIAFLAHEQLQTSLHMADSRTHIVWRLIHMELRFFLIFSVIYVFVMAADQLTTKSYADHCLLFFLFRMLRHLYHLSSVCLRHGRADQYLLYKSGAFVPL